MYVFYFVCYHSGRTPGGYSGPVRIHKSHTGIEPKWARLSPAAQILCPTVGPGGRKREGARGGVALWKESYPWPQRGKIETLAMRAVSPAKCTVDRRQMAAGDDRVCKLVAVRGPNLAAWGVSMADPGVSREGSSSLKRRNLRCGGRAAHYIVRRPSHFSGLWRAA